MPKRHAQTLSIMQINTMFSTEDQAAEWFEEVQWHGKPICHRCFGNTNISKPKSKKHTYWCRSCRKNFTVKQGTIMESSNLDLRIWAIALYYMMTARKGISSLQLSKELGITQKAAWFLLQRIRKGCDRGSFMLAQVVEVDETYLGGKEANKHESKKLNAGRGVVGKQAVMGMCD